MQLNFWDGVMKKWNLSGGFQTGEQKNCPYLYDGPSLFVSLQVTYTFDAGPNAVIFTLQQHVPEFVQVVQHFFPPETNGGQWVDSCLTYLALVCSPL